MYTKTLSAMALIAALGAAPAFGQDHTINGQPVSSGQMEQVQAKCDELRNAGEAAGAAVGQTAPATPVPPAAEPPAAGAAAPAEAAVDLEALTLEMCEAGGFVSSTP